MNVYKTSIIPTKMWVGRDDSLYSSSRKTVNFRQNPNLTSKENAERQLVAALKALGGDYAL